LDDLGQLPVLLVFLVVSQCELTVLAFEVVDDLVLRLELLLDDFELLRVSKGVLALYDFFKLVPEPCALIHVHFHLHLDLNDLGILNVSLQGFDLFILGLAFCL